LKQCLGKPDSEPTDRAFVLFENNFGITCMNNAGPVNQLYYQVDLVWEKELEKGGLNDHISNSSPTRRRFVEIDESPAGTTSTPSSYLSSA
jgi:hypothetical protein